MMTRTYPTAAMACLAMVSSSCGFGHSLVVGNSKPCMTRRKPFAAGGSRNRSSSMNMYVDYDMMPITSLDIPSMSSSIHSAASVSSTPSNLLVATSRLIASDPRLEAEVLNDASHMALDVSTFFSPNTAWLRLCNVIGRVLLLTSDFIQDDSISPDEMIFQISMLAISTRMFLRSAWPLMLAVFSVSSLTVRERRTHALLSEAVGVTVLQFKTLLASRALDWVDYSPDEVVELNGEHMYFLYSGEATSGKNKDTSADAVVLFDEEKVHISSRIFGDVHFAKVLDESLRKKAKTTSKSDKSKTPDAGGSTLAARSSLVVGPNGASMLRISTSKLLQLMENDDELSTSIQRLVLLCMQEKLSRSLEQDGPKPSPKESPSAVHSNDPSSGTPNATHAIAA